MNKKNLSVAARSARFLWIAMLSVWFTACEKALDLKQPAADPSAVFNEAWTTIDRQYALFSVKGVDWASVRNTYGSKITKAMTDKELFKAIDGMLETLKDGHITLMSPADTATYQGFYQLYAKNFDYRNIIDNYLHNDFTSIGPVIYTIRNDIGYFYYRTFEEDISDAQTDQLFLALKNTKGLIIDVRDNPGGNSVNVERIVQRLIRTRKLIKYEKFKSGAGHEDFFDPSPYYLSPAGTGYTNPVCVLTNRSCFSACNDFVLYLTGQPNIKIVGDQTGGGGGIPQDYVLANGWKLQYTATMTLSPAKTTVENGIPPDVHIDISSLDEARGIDSILETAYRLLQ